MPQQHRLGLRAFAPVVLHPARVSSVALMPALRALSYFGLVFYQRHWWITRTRLRAGATAL